MTKDTNDVVMENTYGSNNNYWKHKKRRNIFIPKKLGRKNPVLIKTDSFDFLKTLEQVNKVSDSLGKVASSVGNISQSVGNISQNVKQTTSGNVATTLPKNALTSIGSKILQQSQPSYQQYQPTVYPPSLPNSVMGIPLPFALMTGAVIIFALFKLASK